MKKKKKDIAFDWWAGVDHWILATGVWRDEGIWDDTRVWID